MSEIIVAPSLLSADFSKLGEEINAVIEAGADWLHVDVMDGHFVPNLTMGPAVVASLRKITDKVLDVHLMIENPQNYVEPFAEAGANYITVHIETIEDPTQVIKQIRKAGAKPGLTLKPDTPVDSILPFIDEVDLVLVMTVNPGFSGQGFMPEPVEKIKLLVEERKRKNIDFHIEVDGGINAETKKLCVEAGANVLVAGNYIFKNDYKEAIANLKG